MTHWLEFSIKRNFPQACKNLLLREWRVPNWITQYNYYKKKVYYYLLLLIWLFHFCIQAVTSPHSFSTCQIVLLFFETQKSKGSSFWHKVFSSSHFVGNCHIIHFHLRKGSNDSKKKQQPIIIHSLPHQSQ